MHPMKPRTRIRRMSEKKLKALGGKGWSTISKRSESPRKRPRKKSEFARIYGSKERVLFVKGLPCSACGVVGYSENAHVPPTGESGGVGRKADAKWIVPLCHGRFDSNEQTTTYSIGCHVLYHHQGREYFEAHFRIDLEKCAQETELAWQSRIPERGA